MEEFFRQIFNYSALIIIQLVLGKKGAFLYALFLKMDLYLVSILIIISDLLLMIAVAKIYDATFSRVFPFTLLQKKSKHIEAKIRSSRWANKIIHIGKAGTLIITAIPFSGGVWSGMAVAKILRLKKNEAYWLTGIGTVIGCAIFLAAALGFIDLF